MVLAAPEPLVRDEKTRANAASTWRNANGHGCAGGGEDPSDGIQACGSWRGTCRDGNGGLGNRAMEPRQFVFLGAEEEVSRPAAYRLKAQSSQRNRQKSF